MRELQVADCNGSLNPASQALQEDAVRDLIIAASQNQSGMPGRPQKQHFSAEREAIQAYCGQMSTGLLNVDPGNEQVPGQCMAIHFETVMQKSDCQ